MSLTLLLKTCIAACRDIKPVVHKLYNLIDNTTSMEKADKSIFTVADGLVQHLLADKLFANTKMNIVGEEDVVVNIETEPFTVGGLKIPASVMSDVTTLNEKMNLHAASLAANDYKDITAFIDPIDGTREFSTGKGEQCTICIGFARDGHPVAGVVFRPCTSEMSYAAGCASESFFEMVPTQEIKPLPLTHSLLTTNGSISPFMELYLKRSGAERIRTGGAGNKALRLLEGSGSLYFQDRGLSRWDTCAAQAVLEANGGCLVKLQSVIDNGMPSGYNYIKSDTNSDPNPKANYTPYNSKSTDDGEKIFNPYSNLCGLYALPRKVSQDENKQLVSLLQEVATEVPAAYD